MSSFKKLLRTAHAWAGAGLALFFVMMGLSGATIVFQEEILTALHPEIRAAASADVYATADALVAEYGADRIKALKPPHGGFDAFIIELKDGRELVASRDGAVVANIAPFASVIGTLTKFHMVLFVDGAGKKVQGAFALVLCLFIVTGLLVWPLSGFGWKTLAPRRLDAPSMHALHRNLGALAAPLILLSAATVAGVAFSGPLSQALNKAAGPAQPAPPRLPAPALAGAPLPVSAALRAAEAAMLGGEIVSVQTNRAKAGVYPVRMRAPGEISPKGYTLIDVSSADGSILFARDARDGRWNEKFMESLLPLHSAQSGLPGHKIVAFITGLALAALGGAGVFSFFGRRIRRGRRDRAPAE